jgi:hypothetical protein
MPTNKSVLLQGNSARKSTRSKNKDPIILFNRIMEIYQKVGTAFRQAANQRGERIPAGVMNFIVWKFLQVDETLGDAMVDEHLAYELEKYAREGLRDDYKRDLYLF